MIDQRYRVRKHEITVGKNYFLIIFGEAETGQKHGHLKYNVSNRAEV